MADEPAVKPAEFPDLSAAAQPAPGAPNLELVKDIQMTPTQQEEQRRSFAYGNTKIANDLITRQMIDEAAERLARIR